MRPKSDELTAMFGIIVEYRRPRHGMGQIRSPCLGLERLLAAFRLSSSYKLYVAGNAYTTGTWGGSDARWKKNIDPLENSLDKVAQLNGVNFEWDIDRFPKKGFEKGRQVGLIAREVEKVVPELVGTDEDGYKSVSYEKLSAVLIEAVKELKAENEALKILICQDHPEAVLFQ